MSNLKVDALATVYLARIKKALANLENYLNNSAGIGEHPDVIEEMDKLIREIADAEGCLDVVKKHLTPDSEEA